MKKNLLKIILVLLLLIVANGCKDKKIVPIYQGMVITTLDNEISLKNNLMPKEIDQDDPFHNFDGETIEDEINKNLNIEKSEVYDYYAEPNVFLHLTVKLYNPDNYDILSVTINGEKFQSYNFESVSDNENIVMKIKSEESGVKQITINEIIYADGKKFKSVDITDNKTIKLGVKYSKAPIAKVENLDINSTSFTFDLNVSDGESLIEKSGNIIKAFLYDGKDLIQQKELNIGESKVSFDELKTETLYQFAIVAVYDLNEGDGKRIDIMYKQALYTESIFEIVNINSTSSSIKFDLNINDINEVGNITSIELFKNDELISELNDTSIMEFCGLESNTSYTLKVVYSYLDKFKESKEININTHKITPIISINNLNVDYHKVNFNIDINDIDEIVTIKDIELYKENELIQNLNDLKIREFNDLYSNTEYIIKVKYCYNLNDGKGITEDISELKFKTLEKVVPSIKILIVELTQDAIKFDLDKYDQNKVGQVNKVELFKGDYKVAQLSDFDKLEFTNLLSNTEYKLKVKYIYHLNDGSGVQEIDKEITFKTKIKEKPEVNFNIVEISYDYVKFNCNFIDNDNVIISYRLDLYRNSHLVSTIATNDIDEFNDLLSNNEYLIKIIYVYDLNDGTGKKSETVEHEVTTKAKFVPTIEINDVTATDKTINFSLLINDVSNIGAIKAIEIYNNNTIVNEIDPETVDFNYQFSELLPHTNYKIKVVYSYDLNDGNNEQIIEATYIQATLASPITIERMTILNTTSPKIGEEIHIRFIINNPSNAIIKSFIINGKEIEVVGGDYKTSAIIKFIPQFDGGVYNVQVQSLKYESYEYIITHELESIFEDEILVLGNINVNSIYNEENLISLDKESLIIIKLDNPTGYDVSNITIKFNNIRYSYIKSEITTLDDNHITVPWKSTYNNYTEVFHDISVEEITYGIIDGNYTTKAINNINNRFAILKSLEPRNVSTLDDLIHMENGYIYKLVNDIDLIEAPWNPIEFKGIFDGSGFAIKNMSVVVENEFTYDQHYGLFSKFNGVLENLTLTDVYISINTLGNTYIGGFIGEANNSIVRENTITGIITAETHKSLEINEIIGKNNNTSINNNNCENVIIIM